ncbi:hypothetical protein HYH02_011282 [Chlamydomonas schloesseri]|uniref:Intraflagellar transport protein 43 n=1 Tax=Chlamydomonas schloesseri TaxID=2026947 RepID=A0A835T7F3_9CHLO|nr:hypothetical protein HYH02_011282 [Chlamydomonas schloesseri]|eukprot:KAG2437643.1 hypothetical protein HYH02_011282 [Chlamydomonas schloesseri]
MDDDAPKAAPKAGRRAARAANTWGDDSAAPPEPQKGGFGLDSGFGGGGTSPPRGSAFGADDSSGPPRHVASTTFGGEDEPTPPGPSRQRTGDAGGDRPSRGAAPPSRPPPAEILGDDSKKFVGVSRRKQEQLARGDDEVSRKNLKYETLTAGVDGIMEIPELEEEGREDLSNIVAEAPKVRTNKVQGMDELEEDMHYKLPAMDDRDIDLSLLTAVLCSSEQVAEAEEPWDPDIVLTEVASAINAEREKAEGGGEAPDDMGGLRDEQGMPISMKL